MSPGVYVLKVSRISLPQPSMELSFFDSFMVGAPPIQRLMLFPGGGSDDDLSFESMVRALKSSLSATLVDFSTLAGKLTYVPSTETVELDLQTPEVTFVEAEAESELDLHHLATCETHDVESFKKLVPSIDVSALPFPVCAVQATRFGCGGIAVGISVHHAVVDGKALLHFMEAWSERCRAEMSDAGPSADNRKPPVLDRAAIKYPDQAELARHLLKWSAPALPSMKNTFMDFLEQHNRSKITDTAIRRTFVVDAASVQFLKKHVAAAQTQRGERQPSTFAAISAHVWSCVARSKPFAPDEPTVFCFPMDCRSRLDPPVPDEYFGNCIRTVFAWARSGDVLDDKDGVNKACAAIQETIRTTLKGDPLRDCRTWSEEFRKLPHGTVVNATASPRFRVYDAADFGWGRPARYELVSMNLPREFVLVAGREEGSVQVSVVLDSDDGMEAFAKVFMDIGSSDRVTDVRY